MMGPSFRHTGILNVLLFTGVAWLLSSCERIPEAPNLPDNAIILLEPRENYPFVQNLASYEAQPGDTLYSILLNYSHSPKFTLLADTAAVIQTPFDLIYLDSGYSLAVAVEHASTIEIILPTDLDANNPDWVTFGDQDAVARYFDELKKASRRKGFSRPSTHPMRKRTS